MAFQIVTVVLIDCNARTTVDASKIRSFVIVKMKLIFGSDGIPDRVVCDNGPQFAYMVFSQYYSQMPYLLIRYLVSDAYTPVC